MSYPATYWTRDIPEHWFSTAGLLRPDQLAALCYVLGWPFWGDDGKPRDPGLIVSVGCGTGVLEAQLESMGHTVIGVDPFVPAEMYQGTRLERAWDTEWHPGTVVFCESAEHVIDLRALIEGIRCRIVITNWIDRHPIYPDESGWDHVTAIDEWVFDMIAKGRTEVLRRGSHLVVE